MEAIYSLIPYAVVLTILGLKGLCIVKQDQRAVVFKFGRIDSVAGPGVHFFLPGVFLVKKIVLSQKMPGAHGLSETELNKRLIEMATKDPGFLSQDRR